MALISDTTQGHTSCGGCLIWIAQMSAEFLRDLMNLDQTPLPSL